MRVLPATSLSGIWVVDPEGCTGAGHADCTNGIASRGGLFSRNTSSTFTQIGLFGLDNVQAQLLGLIGNGIFGFDNVGLESDVLGSTSMVNQTVAGIATGVFNLGAFGLSPEVINNTKSQNSPSFFGSLESGSKIPSRTWSFTPGIFNRKFAYVLMI
jgi:hypothetical protein